MSTPPPAAALSLSDQAVLTVLCGLLPVDTPRELSIPQLAAAGGFLQARLGASLAASSSLPTLPPARCLTPHIKLWQHLLASQGRRNPTDWLLSGVTVMVLAEATVLTCADEARTSFARSWHCTLASALRALELPHTLEIQQAPAEAGPALAPGALDAALAVGSVEALLDAVKPLPNLSEAEARALLAQVQAGQAAQERQATLKRPSAELAQALVRGHAAWERLILSHVRLVVMLARRTGLRHVSEGELVQAGLLGLMQDVAQSDGKLECAFFTFACRAIKRAIWDAGERERPFRCSKSQERMARARRELETRLGRVPSVEEIAQQAGMLRETVVAVLEAEGGVASLNAPLRVDAEVTLGDLIADAQALSPEAAVLAQEEAQDRRNVLGSALAGLEPDARQVIALRFGLVGPAQGLREVARELGWTVPQVRRVEAEALATLRERMVGGAEAGC